ncbi:MAG: hypothetical protein HRT61_04915, partial [Ekhidna sp.]|nr:hypothetical protein [Ekhidna sp.]
MRSLFLSFSVILLFAGSISAQRYSEDIVEFENEAISKLRSVGTESAKKIAFDFKNAWDGKFTNAQQEKIHSIALTMQKKGYKFYPYFYHYFTYLAYSVTQEGLQTDQLSKVLEINEQVVHTLSKSEYRDFLFGLNIYFGRKYLSLDKTLSVQAAGGAYEFKLLDEYIAIEPEEEMMEEDTSDLISDDEMPEIVDDAAGDSWGDSGDSWGNNDDSWGNSNDSWGSNDDSWG